MFVNKLNRYTFMAHHTYFEVFSVVRITKEEANDRFHEGEAVAKVLALNDCTLISGERSVKIEKDAPYALNIEDILVIDKLENKIFTLDKIFDDANYIDDYNNLVSYLSDLTILKETLV
jgi:hypothetical protein